MNTDGHSLRVLPKLAFETSPAFVAPCKKIHESHDVTGFLVSKAYTDIMTFLLQLNRSMFPAKLGNGETQAWPLHSDAVQFSAPVRQLQGLLGKVEDIIKEVPPDSGPRRFGNISFRKWHQVLADRASELLGEFLPPDLLQARSPDPEASPAEVELKAYFLGSWGSGQRLDYGTGHELSFLAFIAAIWKLGGFPQSEDGVEERAIVLGVIEPYLELVRNLIKTYTLEPAGSHGVWGLDDHSFLPYIFGSAQLSPAINETDLTPEEGSLPGAPDPGDVAKSTCVERERKFNLYFAAIGFIYDVKKGPFWEHSPMLYDISGVRAGWGKINKGMVKMYNAEVLSKFPVVQHFPFGSLFSWDRHPNAIAPAVSTHTQSGPQSRAVHPNVGSSAAAPRPSTDAGTRAPWARPTVPSSAERQGPSPSPSTVADSSRLPPGPMAPVRAPWAVNRDCSPPGGGPTKAPWAK